MNKLNFIPTKDYEGNRLKSGILQLPDRCHLVLDETALQPGQLDVNGMFYCCQPTARLSSIATVKDFKVWLRVINDKQQSCTCFDASCCRYCIIIIYCWFLRLRSLNSIPWYTCPNAASQFISNCLLCLAAS